MLRDKRGVFGMYRDFASSTAAIGKLHERGFHDDAFARLRFPEAEETSGRKRRSDSRGYRAVSRISVGATLGWMAGIGAFVLPGLGGPRPSEISNDDLIATLITAGVPQQDATRYSDRVRTGEIFLIVYATDASDFKRAQETLQETGADAISSK